MSSADRLALSLYGVQPGQELGGGGSAAGVGPGGAHPVGELVGAFGPAGHERRMRQDRRTEQRVVGFPGGLERPDEGGVGVVGLA